MDEKEKVIHDALKMMGIEEDNLFELNETTFINKRSVAPNGLRYFSCYYGDFDWVMDEAANGISWGILSEEELEDGSYANIDSPEAFDVDFVGGLKFNRRKFRLALEKLCEVEQHDTLIVNVIFAVSDGGDEVAYVQITNYIDSWVL